MTEAASKSVPGFEGTKVENCYQCGKCTAGCPVADKMDVVPNQILRLVQANLLEKARHCLAIWTCLACQTCTARCPQDVDCAGVIDAVRHQAVAQGIVPERQQRVFLFQRAFLDSVRRNGRVAEVELIAQFKRQAFFKDFNIPLAMKDALLAPKLMQRGKFHLMGEKVRDREVVRRIFDKCEAAAKAHAAGGTV